jgi:D-alanine-D-alanine ligase
MTLNSQRPNIALIAGGYSGEATVSVKSASVIMQNIDKSKFQVYLVSITRDGWVCLHGDDKFPIDKNDFSVVVEGQKIQFDTAFIMIHGTPGEDGVLQSYFDMIGMPYTSCSAVVSAVTFSKYFCNKVMKAFGGVHVAESCCITSSLPYDIQDVASKIGFPCFVKPNAGGSSIGTTKVHKIEELQLAIDRAFVEDDEVLVERFIKGKEITCGVIRSNGNLISFPLTEVRSKKEFFDFEAKYDPELADEITPAPIDEALAIEIRQMSEKYYDLYNCNGVVRFDYIVDGDQVWFLEVNTIPGMSAESIVPQQARAYGWSYTELTTRIIEESLRNANNG